MSETVIPKIAVDIMMRNAISCESRSGPLEKIFDDERGTLIKIVLGELALINLRMSSICLAHVAVMNTINNLADILEKLPDKKEFDGLKTELEQTRTNAISTLAPLKEMLKEAEERQRRASEMNGYG